MPQTILELQRLPILDTFDLVGLEDYGDPSCTVCSYTCACTAE